jgi:hypothetical protein
MAVQSATRGEHSISLLGNDLFALLDALNFEKVHLIGPSIGGMIAQSVAATAEAVHLLALERPKESIEVIGGFLDELAELLKKPGRIRTGNKRERERNDGLQ